MATKLLLVEDVETLGHSGEVVSVKPGYARNFLIPQGFAVIADKQTLRLQERLREERKQRAAVDRKESEELAARIEGVTLTKVVKVDPEGHMYGSVTIFDIIDLLRDQAQIEVEKKHISLKHAIKATGVHSIPVKLKEGVTTAFTLKVMSEEGYRATQEGTPS